jgi:hypothetical protein
MTSFFYVISIAYHTSVPALRKCMDTSRERVFWLRAQPLMHRLLHLFVVPKRLASHRLFERYKDMKVTGGEIWRVRRMWNTLEGQILLQRAVWDRGLSCCNKTPVPRSPRHLHLIAGRRWFFRRSAYFALFTGFPSGHIVLQDYPSFIPKESQHNLSRRWLCAWPGRGESVTKLVPFMNFLVHSYTCCTDRHASPYWTYIRRWISMGFTPSLLKKTDDRTLFFVGACCKRGRHLYTTTAPSCWIPTSYYHVSATLQTMSITVVNLQDNRAVFRIFIALLRFSLDSPS